MAETRELNGATDYEAMGTEWLYDNREAFEVWWREQEAKGVALPEMISPHGIAVYGAFLAGTAHAIRRLRSETPPSEG